MNFNTNMVVDKVYTWKIKVNEWHD